MKIGRFLWIAIGILAGFFVARYAYGTYRFDYVARHFDSVHAGDSAAAVIGKLGRPNYHSGACLQDLRLSQSCSSEFVYGHPLAPMMAEYYVIDFSPQGGVIALNRLTSP